MTLVTCIVLEYVLKNVRQLMKQISDTIHQSYYFTMNDTSIEFLVKAVTTPINHFLWKCPPNLDQGSLCLLYCFLTGSSRLTGSYLILSLQNPSIWLRSGDLGHSSTLSPACQFRAKTTALLRSGMGLVGPGPCGIVNSLSQRIFGWLVRSLAAHSDCLAGV